MHGELGMFTNKFPPAPINPKRNCGSTEKVGEKLIIAFHLLSILQQSIVLRPSSIVQKILSLHSEMTTTVTIRPAFAEDAPAIMSLIRELADYENAPAEVLVNEEDVLREGFGTDPIFTVHVAETAGEVVGIALFYTGYSTWKGRMIYLDDLVVRQERRGQGIGKLLLESVFEYARQTKANLVKWQVLDWNKPAIKFYKQYPVSFDGEWLNCRIMTEALTTTTQPS